MGYRTIVIFDNDRLHDWSNDPELGNKIATAMNHVNTLKADFHGGVVVECTHADTKTLAVVDSFEFHPVAGDYWTSKVTDKDGITLNLLRRAAAVLGYRLAKIPEKSNDGA
jgi:hypothetical protein